MSRRIIEIANNGHHLRIQHRQLIIDHPHRELVGIPIEDIAALIIDSPQTTLTHASLNALVSSNVMVVCSDEKHQPSGMFLPLQSNSLQTERIAAQAEIALPIKKKLWKQLVQAKVNHQAKVLRGVSNNDAGLKPLAKKVRSGDPDNIEAQASRRYWSRLFSGQGFKRDREASDQNRFLNYGYAILRSLVSRHICAAGLHPSLGLHHRNRYNPFCLADDLMEPYRPLIDLVVWNLVNTFGTDGELSREIRMELLRIVEHPISVRKEQLTLQGAIQKTAQSMANVVVGDAKELVLPDF